MIKSVFSAFNARPFNGRLFNEWSGVLSACKRQLSCMRRSVAFTALSMFAALFLMPCFGADLSAYVNVNNGIVETSAQETVQALKEKYAASSGSKEKLEILTLLAPLQEQLGLYQDAQTNYSIAANLSASIKAASGENAAADETLLLGAVRCALSCGDTPSADYILSTAFSAPVSAETQAYKVLYAVWSWLCKSEDGIIPAQPVAVLKQSVQQSSMKVVKPVMLLTLWYVTGDRTYAAQLEKEYPQSPECAVVKGNASLMPVPFWFFVPKAN